MIIITPRADPRPKFCSALLFVSFLLQILTIISLTFQLFYSYTNRHTMLILIELRYGSSCGAILVNDTLYLNEDYGYTFISLLGHCISQSEKGILYRDEYVFSYRTTSGRNITNILDTIFFPNMEILFDTNEIPKLNVVLQSSYLDIISYSSGNKSKTLCCSSCHKLDLIRVVCLS